MDADTSLQGCIYGVFRYIYLITVTLPHVPNSYKINSFFYFPYRFRYHNPVSYGDFPTRKMSGMSFAYVHIITITLRILGERTMQKPFHTILPALLTLLFTIPVAAVESSITTFEEALEETGWSVYRTFSGDLVLTAPSEKRAIPITSEDIDLETLGNKLEAAGWKVQRKADGSLDLHPRETAKREEAITREEAPTPSPADKRWEQIQQQLKAAGWDASREADGSLVLIPPGETAETTTQKEKPVPSAVDEQWEQMQQQLKAAGWDASRDADGSLVLIPPGETAETTTRKEEPAPSAADKQWEQMQQQLKAAGWGASREADGSLVLIPPGESLDTAAPEEEAAAEKQNDAMESMQEKLRESGWQVTENSDGSILFYHPKQQRSEKGTIRPARGHAPPTDFDLPVTSWTQARTLTLKWLMQQSPGNLTMGKIREIYDVYLVSILSNSRSDRLRHQIAVRKSDGHIIVLN